MLTASFALAAQSPGRQAAFRRAVVAHLAVLAGAVSVLADADRARGSALVGHVALAAGVVEGAVLLGWRLTQLPRSQALEFLLVSPRRPSGVFLAEALVGLSRLALVTLSGLPLLAILVVPGCVAPEDVPVLLAMPFTWGAVTGLGLAAWAYEPLGVRRWGERLALGLVLLYLIAGVLGGEHLYRWAAALGGDGGAWFLTAARASLDYNPFGVMHAWLVDGAESAWGRALAVEGAALTAAALLVARASGRLRGHFHERHYQPAPTTDAGKRRRVGDQPLSWWAVKRVSQFSGRINFWLAAGFGVLYAAYTLAGPSWPSWLGRQVFVLFENVGGIPSVTTGLVLLAAVPAAFQYGLWDSNAQDRCRRLELLLLTRLQARDYWAAAAAAAWQRGRGYFGVAVLLWGAALVAGQASPTQVAAALAAGVAAWCLSFALGFRAFSRGLQANGLGLFLTVGLPLLAACFERGSWPRLTALLPPGAVYAAGARTPELLWALGPAATCAVTLAAARLALTRCDDELRRWYERHHGSKLMS